MCIIDYIISENFSATNLRWSWTRKGLSLSTHSTSFTWYKSINWLYTVVYLASSIPKIWFTYVERNLHKDVEWNEMNDNSFSHQCRSLHIGMVLTFRIFFSNMSNLFKNNMKDVFCQEKKGTNVKCQNSIKLPI